MDESHRGVCDNRVNFGWWSPYQRPAPGSCSPHYLHYQEGLSSFAVFCLALLPHPTVDPAGTSSQCCGLGFWVFFLIIESQNDLGLLNINKSNQFCHRQGHFLLDEVAQNLILNTSSGGAYTTFLDNLFQCLIILIMKKNSSFQCLI